MDVRQQLYMGCVMLAGRVLRADGDSKGMRARFCKYGRTYGVIASLAALTITAQGSSLGLVLCIRADGHVEVKTACGCSHGQARSEVSQTDEPSLSLSKPGHFSDHCGPCVDVPLSIDTGIPTAPVQGFSPSIKVSMSEECSCVQTKFEGIAADTSTQVLLASRPPPYDSSLSALRTIILLC
jgi:hypothetical protein